MSVHIIDVREVTKPIASAIRNAYIDFTKMTTSLVAVITDVVRDGKPVVYVKHGDHFEATAPKIKLQTENRTIVENLPEGTEVALVDPEAQHKKQPQGASSSAMGVGQ